MASNPRVSNGSARRREDAAYTVSNIKRNLFLRTSVAYGSVWWYEGDEDAPRPDAERALNQGRRLRAAALFSCVGENRHHPEPSGTIRHHHFRDIGMVRDTRETVRPSVTGRPLS